jgi:hypothetical protein
MRVIGLVLVLVACSLVSCGKSSEKSAPAASDQKGGGEPGAVGAVPEDPDQLGQGRGRFAVELGDDFTAVGDIDKSTVKQTVKANLAKLTACYERTLLANPGVEGKVLATFKVAIDGTVRDAKASGVHPDVETCVADVIKTFRFPTGTAEVEVSYPFTFKAN